LLTIVDTENESIMIAEVGLFALIIALVLSLLQSTVPLVGATRQDRGLMAFASQCAIGVFICVALAFALLTSAFVTSDFSLVIVATHSQLAKPLVYKFTGVWANHEGSMLLWVLVLVLFSSAIAVFGRGLPDTLKARVLAVQGMIASAFLAFVIFTSNPFARLAFAPADGNGMNPLLQDPGLAVHPPCLYLGYVGFSVTFSFAVAALMEGKVDAAWARWVRPWVLAAWCFLTLGITLGSFWAYYILGWGGWWFWDPVENVSLMPWLAGTALLHSAIVVERRHALVSWTIFLAILTFSLSLIGTFVVRSGVLTSVHSFAQDPERGVFILAILVSATGGALALYALRIPAIKSGATFSFISRESGLSLNNVLLVTATATVFIGTFYPLVIDLMGNEKISVGPPYYNRTFVPIFVPLLILLALGPLLRWKRGSLREVVKKLRIPIGLAVLSGMSIVVLGGIGFLLTALGITLSIWLIAGSIWAIFARVKLGEISLDSSATLLSTTPRAVFGMATAHLGLGLVVGAITTVMTWQSENILSMAEGDTATIAGYSVRLRNIAALNGTNYEAEQGAFDVTFDNAQIATLVAERRFFPVQQQQTTQTAIRTNIISNLYIALGEPDGRGKWTVRLYYHPLAPFLWIGGFTMALGGFLSLSDRRFRIGAPQRASKRQLAPA
jgi:cytochrome c-type biogenesis protein CcmF